MTAEVWLVAIGSSVLIALAAWLFWEPLCDGIEAMLEVMVDG